MVKLSIESSHDQNTQHHMLVSYTLDL